MKTHIVVLSICISLFFIGAAWFVFFRQSQKIPHGPNNISVRLKWLHQAQFAGLYTADKKGWYSDSGLSVTLKPFDFKNQPVDDVVSGNSDFGVAGALDILTAREQGKPIVALAVIYKENPVVAYTASASSITKPIDFIGKRLGMQQGSDLQTIIHAMLAIQGIDWKKEVTEIPIGHDAIPLMNGTVDIATGYATNEPILARELGFPVRIIEPHHFGVKLYADVLFTTQDMIQKNPELVRSFVLTTLRGWEYALMNVDEAVKYTLKYQDPNNKALNMEHQLALLQASIPYIKPSPNYRIGSMSYVEWNRAQSLLFEHGVLKTSADVTDAYTTEFIR